MTPTEYRNRRGRYAWLAIGLLPPLLAIEVLVQFPGRFGTGPVDVTRQSAVLVPTVLAVLLAAVLAGVTDRSSVLVGPGGVTNVPFGSARSAVRVPWSDVVEVRARWTPIAWRVRLSRRHGRPVTLAAPLSPPWWPGRRFRRELAGIQEHLPLGTSRPPVRPAAGLAYLLWVPVLSGALLAAVPAPGDRGVVGPWTATATSAPRACALLQPALDEYPSVRTGPSRAGTTPGHERCERWSTGRQPVGYLSATVDREHGLPFSSPVAVAMRDVDSGCAHVDGVRVPGLADEACVGTAGDPTHHLALVRRADVLITIEATGTDGERVATSLARHAAPLVRVG